MNRLLTLDWVGKETLRFLTNCGERAAVVVHDGRGDTVIVTSRALCGEHPPVFELDWSLSPASDPDMMRALIREELIRRVPACWEADEEYRLQSRIEMFKIQSYHAALESWDRAHL